MKKKPVQISITNPCSQNWDTMAKKEAGRFCDQCQKNVVDFTKHSDKDILQYLQQASGKVCGRFRLTQLNRDLILLHERKYWSVKPVAIAASMAALLISGRINAGKVRLTTITTLSPYEKSQVPVTGPGGSIIISATVRDTSGAAIKSAMVTIEKDTIYTDQNGFFQYIVPAAMECKPFRMTIANPGFGEVILIIDPDIQPVPFDIILFPQEEIVMGGIGVYDIDWDELKLQFDYSFAELTTEAKITVATVAKTMRNNPWASVELQASGKDQKEINKAKKWLQNIKNYIVDKEGISEERITTKIVPYQPQLKNIIQFRNCEH